MPFLYSSLLLDYIKSLEQTQCYFRCLKGQVRVNRTGCFYWHLQVRLYLIGLTTGRFSLVVKID